MHDRVSKQCWFGAIIQYPTHPTVLSLNLRGWACESEKKVTQDMIWMNVWSVCRKGILITILSKIKIVSANDRLIECKLYSMGHSIKLANFTTVSIREKKINKTTTITSPQTNNKQTDITNNKQTNIQPKNSASCIQDVSYNHSIFYEHRTVSNFLWLQYTFDGCT